MGTGDFNPNKHNEDAIAFYNDTLLPKINKCKESIESTKKLLSRISNKGYMNSMLLEQIKDTINGDNIYAELSSEDIDRLIESFKELREDLNV